MQKTILVTGAAGFIGFHLCLYLKARGNSVYGVDNFNSYYSPILKRARAKHLSQHGIEIFEEDVCNQSFLEQTLDDKKITHFVHLAAQAGVRHAQKKPRDYLHSNLEGFLSVLEALKERAHIPLIYASSSSVYGKNKKVPFSESDPVDEPVNLYGATKKANELMATSYHHLYGLKVTGLRYFTVYGPWGRPDMAYFKFCKNILENKPLEIFGKGLMRRDFTYIDDIIQGTASAIDLSFPHEIFNLGNNSSVEVTTLVELLEKHLQAKATKKLLPVPPGEVFATYADITKAKNLLGYNPVTSIEEGIERFVTWKRLFDSEIVSAQ